MRAPLDYAANDADPLGVEAGDITYAALLDRHARREEPITDEMIRRACLRMETAQAWPFAAPEETPRVTGGAFDRLLRVLR